MEEEFARHLNTKGDVEGFFFLWEYAGKEEEDQKEIPGLRKLGALSKRLYEEQDFRGLSELFYGIVFQHALGLLHLEGRDDFEELTDRDLLTRGLLPPEIFFQFFLLGTLSRRTDFDWDRGEIIAHQNLACFIVCFGDIYEFFHEREEEKTERPKKIGRNDPCYCGSGKKYKKCCGK